MKPRHRLATDKRLEANARITLEGNAAHYLTHVLRMGTGDSVALFGRGQGEWLASLSDIRKKAVELTVEKQLRAVQATPDMIACFAPIKGGRLETIIEKATELGACVLQPVITQRTIVTQVNLERAEAIAREAAEQCERTDWPEMREPVKLLPLLGGWDAERPLLYGDESGESGSISDQLKTAAPKKWGILVGPEGGFSAEELQALAHMKAGRGVSLGPRILRADTALITLCGMSMAAWGDWDKRPRFEGETA